MYGGASLCQKTFYDPCRCIFRTFVALCFPGDGDALFPLSGDHSSLLQLNCQMSTYGGLCTVNAKEANKCDVLFEEIPRATVFRAE